MHSYSSLNSPIKRVLRLIQISNTFVESDRPARTNYSTEAPRTRIKFCVKAEHRRKGLNAAA